MNINDLDAVPSFDPDLNTQKTGDCGTCNSDIFDNYTKCTKCGALICPDCKEEDWCKSCEEDYEKLKDEELGEMLIIQKNNLKEIEEFVLGLGEMFNKGRIWYLTIVPFAWRPTYFFSSGFCSGGGLETYKIKRDGTYAIYKLEDNISLAKLIDNKWVKQND